MAEAIARHVLKTGEVPGVQGDVLVVSGGLSTEDGIPISDHTVTALERLGISCDGTSKQVSAEMIRKADLIFTMTQMHQHQAQRMLGNDERAKSRVQRLDPEEDIEDPIGHGEAAYHALAKRFRKLIPTLLAQALVTQDSSQAHTP